MWILKSGTEIGFLGIIAQKEQVNSSLAASGDGQLIDHHRAVVRVFTSALKPKEFIVLCSYRSRL